MTFGPYKFTVGCMDDLYVHISEGVFTDVVLIYVGDSTSPVFTITDLSNSVSYCTTERIELLNIEKNGVSDPDQSAVFLSPGCTQPCFDVDVADINSPATISFGIGFWIGDKTTIYAHSQRVTISIECGANSGTVTEGENVHTYQIA